MKKIKKAQDNTIEFNHLNIIQKNTFRFTLDMLKV